MVSTIFLAVTDFLYIDGKPFFMPITGIGHGCPVNNLPEGKVFTVKSESSISLTFGYKESKEKGKELFSGNKEQLLVWNQKYKDEYW